MTQTQRPGKKRSGHIQAESKDKRPFKLGDILEYRVVRLFIHLGFFTRRSREIYTVGYLDTATDLDVLAIRYTEPLRREVQIIECKSGTGDGPMDRVFWLAGVKQYVGANRATLVRPATKWNVKDFAGELGIEILDLPHLGELERAAGVNPSFWPGSSDREYFAGQLEEWNRVLNRDAIAKELFVTLAGEIRFHDPFGGISFLLHHLRALTRELQEQRFACESLTRYLLAESVAQLAVFLMRVSELTLSLSGTDRDGFIRKGLTYGHMDKSVVDRLFSNAKRITSEMIRHYTGHHVNIEDTYFTMPEPPNISEVQELVKMLVSRPRLADSFPPLTDLLLFERFLKQREVIDLLPRVFPFTDLKERLLLVQDYLKILGSINAVPESLFGATKKPHPEGAADSTNVQGSE